ncbi:MAG: GNAT family N-acetyltransferase [Alicyclobacillus sp. RIFOXYA1_FULL_53_8]|nr:MAG: GNAT family N-acetyltransferase [Alicyclobacillus sp. RIFOXYA1_FULL_53_8]
MLMILTTNRLVMRDFCPSDFEAVHKYASDAEVCKYTDWGPNTIQDTRVFLEQMLDVKEMQPRNAFTLAIVDAATNILIGACSLTLDGRQGEIGYTLTREFWGNGFATEAGSALLDLGFKELKLHRIFATCRPNNIGSVRVLEKIGMRKEGHLRQHRFFKGQWNDSYLFAILASEYDI